MAPDETQLHPVRVGDIWCHKKREEYEVLITAFYVTVIFGKEELSEDRFRTMFRYKTTLRSN